MAKGYKDFFSEKTINYLYTDSLEIHHLLPLGSDPDLKVGESTKKLRKDKYNPYNSPLNMLFVTKTSNGEISDWSYARYIQDDRIRKVLNTVGCISGLSSDVSIEDFLSARYDLFESAISERLGKLRDSLK